MCWNEGKVEFVGKVGSENAVGNTIYRSHGSESFPTSTSSFSVDRAKPQAHCDAGSIMGELMMPVTPTTICGFIFAYSEGGPKIRYEYDVSDSVILHLSGMLSHHNTLNLSRSCCCREPLIKQSHLTLMPLFGSLSPRPRLFFQMPRCQLRPLILPTALQCYPLVLSPPPSPSILAFPPFALSSTRPRAVSILQ